MGRWYDRERLSRRKGASLSPADTFLEDLSTARQMGLATKGEDPAFGRISREDGLPPARIEVLRELGRGNPAAGNAAWAAYYTGAVQAVSGLCRPAWYSIIQQQLTKAFFRFRPEGAMRLLAAHSAVGETSRAWMLTCTGAVAVARVAIALSRVNSSIHMASPVEDAKGKIDLLFRPKKSMRGLCFQIKSDQSSEMTLAGVVDPSMVDPSDGRLGSLVRGAARLPPYDIEWLPVYLTVGKQAEIHPEEVWMCPKVRAAVEDLLWRAYGISTKKTEPTP